MQRFIMCPNISYQMTPTYWYIFCVLTFLVMCTPNKWKYFVVEANDSLIYPTASRAVGFVSVIMLHK